MNLVGSLRLPCNHHRVNTPTEVGTKVHRCDTCKKSHTLVVVHSATLTEKCGKDVYTAKWERAANA